MRVDARYRSCVVYLLAWCAYQPLARAQQDGDVEATTAFYVRTDSDQTTIVSPRVHVAAKVTPDTTVDALYTADVWSSASIDIRSAATKRITEQRDELGLALEHAFADTTLRGSYRYSTEHDYDSHGGSVSASFDFASHATMLAPALFGSVDRVGRAGDPSFERDATLLGARVSLTQVIDTHMFAQLTYEIARQHGYLASPYRYVRIGDEVGPELGPCVLPSTQCVHENNPEQRLRHAVVLSLRRALNDTFSAGASYRYYRDDWKLSSHTIRVDVAAVFGDAFLLGIDYRYYQQTAAEHYRPVYPADPLPEFRTSDKELSPLSSHRIGVELSWKWQLGTSAQLTAAVLAAPSLFLYSDFPWLERISAFESSAAVELVL